MNAPFETRAAFERVALPLAGSCEANLAVRLSPSGGAPAAPLSVLVLLDASGSMEERGKMVAAREAVLSLWRRLAAGDRLTLATFASLVTPLLDGHEKGRGSDSDVVAALEKAVPSGITRLDLALERAPRLLGSAPAVAVRQAWVVTDGQPTDGSGRALSDLAPLQAQAERISASGILLGALGYGDAANFNAPFLGDLAARGRSRFMFAPTGPELLPELDAALAAAKAVRATDAVVHVTLDPDFRIVGACLALPQVAPMDAPAGSSATVRVGAIADPETVLLLRVAASPSPGMRRVGKVRVGSASCVARVGGAEVRGAEVPIEVEFATGGSRKLNERNADIDRLCLLAEIALIDAMRAREADGDVVRRQTDDLKRKATRAGLADLAAQFDSEAQQLAAGKPLSANQKATSMKRSGRTGDLRRPGDGT